MANEMYITGQENQSLPITEDEFISEIQTELTVGCSLPFTVPKKEIKRIIKYAAKWFYKNYEYAVEERYGIIPHELMISDDFKKYRTITLPGCIESIFKVQKTSGEASFTGQIRNMADFTLEKLIFQNYRATAGISENLLLTITYQYWADLAASVVLYPVTYNYNRNTSKLWIGGQIPAGDLVMNMYVDIPIESLFNDEIFYDYVVAKTKTELSRILGTFQFNLVGGVSINFDLLQTEGQDRLTEIKEQIKGDEGADWFFTTNSQ